MRDGPEYNILILSEGTPRVHSLADMVQELFSGNVKVQIVPAEQYKLVIQADELSLCILDLAGNDQPSHLLIRQIKRLAENLPIIVLHIYKTPELIRPLYDMGVNGYLNSEPSSADLKSAIETVSRGGVWYPAGVNLSKKP